MILFTKIFFMHNIWQDARIQTWVLQPQPGISIPGCGCRLQWATHIPDLQWYYISLSDLPASSNANILITEWLVIIQAVRVYAALRLWTFMGITCCTSFSKTIWLKSERQDIFVITDLLFTLQWGLLIFADWQSAQCDSCLWTFLAEFTY